MAEPFKIGLIGTGGISRAHLPVYEQFPEKSVAPFGCTVFGPIKPLVLFITRTSRPRPYEPIRMFKSDSAGFQFLIQPVERSGERLVELHDVLAQPIDYLWPVLWPVLGIEAVERMRI